jgi:hypothetical protein
MAQPLRDTQCDVSAADEQHPLHHAAGMSGMPAIHPRACASGRLARERILE